MHRIVHCATQTAALGDLDNVGAMAEIVHRWAVRGPQHLVSRSDATGAGLLKVAERKEGAKMLMEAHSVYTDCANADCFNYYMHDTL